MISREQAKLLVGKKYPDLEVVKVMDYDDLHFVVETSDGHTDSMSMDPYYGVDRKTGEVTSFSPSADIEKFFEMLERNSR